MVDKTKAKESKKTDCPLTREEFHEKAQALTLVINGTALAANPRDFSSKSFGWRNNDKITIVIDGKPVKAQIGLNIMVVGSKDAK